MKKEALTKLASAGVVSEKMAARIAADALFIEKIAAPASGGKAKAVAGIMGKAKEFLHNATPSIIAVLGSSALAGGLGYLLGKQREEEHQKNLVLSRQSLFNQNHQFKKNPDQFHQRFNELSIISPTVAANPMIASKIIAHKLNSGFDVEDIHKLTQLNYHQSLSPGVPPASAAAMAKALHTFEQSADLHGRMGIDFIKNLAFKNLKGKEPLNPEPKVNEYINPEDRDKAESLAERTLARRFKKQSSADLELSLNVSEECLGRMLAERHIMYKRAHMVKQAAEGKPGIIGRAFSSLKPGAKAAGDYLKFMAVPLAIGGGIQLVRNLMQQRETDKMRAEANRVYSGIVRSSDRVKSNRAAADEAFDVLRQFAPALATKPIIARTFVEHAVDSAVGEEGMGRLTPEQVKLLSETQQLVTNLDRHSGGSFTAGIKDNMATFFGGGPSLGSFKPKTPGSGK